MLNICARTLLLSAVSMVCVAAQAATIIDTLSLRNPPELGGWSGFWTESAMTPSTAGQVSSLIQVNQATLLSKIEWTGLNSASKRLFTLCVYSDAGAGPDKLIAEQVLLARTTGTLTAGDATDTFHAAAVNLGGSLKAGKYWVSVLGLNKFAIGMDGPDRLTGSGGAGRLTATAPWQVLNDEVTFYTGRGASLRINGYTYDNGQPLKNVSTSPSACKVPAATY
ncbi:hypothetical protein [Aquabacterium sp.]|uniref:hypothetical protein n=1 Tax=Aquabacterium sp. TaxID=1872578 RepID=UPI002486F47E|nr:hypothetical protein [Aquabacterium sp.]MDI1257998.1 hypothetical protein [Aquabacterium sp.]